MKASIRFKRDATAGSGRPCYRLGEVIDDAPIEFMRSVVHQGVAEWVEEPEAKKEPTKKRTTKKKSDKSEK